MGHVVVVDADSRSGRALADLLLKLGHRVDVAESVSGARAALAARPELIFVGAGPGGDLIDPTWEALCTLPGRGKVVWTGPLRELVEPALDADIGDDFLAIPPRLPALNALLARHRGAATDRWSGADFLAEIDGPAHRFPPARVAFLAHRVGASGWLVVAGPGGEEAVAFAAGRVVGARSAGALGAALGLPTGAGELAALVGAAIAGGRSPDEAMVEIALCIGDLWLGCPADARVLWRAEAPPRPLGLPLPVPRLLARCLERARPAAALRGQLGARRGDRLSLSLPDDAEEGAWGLSPAALRLVRAAGRAPTLGALLEAGGADRDDVWLALDWLLHLGLLQAEAPAGDISGISVEGVDVAPEGPPIRPAVAAPPARPAAVPPAPRPAAAAAPARPGGPAEPLQALLTQLTGAAPWDVFELSAPADVNIDELDKRFRAASSAHHPDRHGGSPPEVARLSAEIFALVQAARAAFDSEDFRKEVRERLLCRAEGRPYVSDADRKAARLHFKKGEAALRARRMPEAVEELAAGAARDPLDWEIAVQLIIAEWRAEKVPPLVAAERLLAVKTDRKSVNADIQYHAGEMLLSAGKEDEAYKRFSACLEKDPEHVGAQRRLRLRQAREVKEVEARSSSALSGIKGLFSGWGKKPGG